uniref:39S ribosomal protein L27, mitochondrial n=1 Tax=Callithrix jacchus TaxID=9483 RepID=UPI0023DCFA0E|nr:39S ribosomal protein L27, mitochondrial [Callithrix jacchus]
MDWQKPVNQQLVEMALRRASATGLQRISRLGLKKNCWAAVALRIRTAVTSLLSPSPATALAVRYASKKTGGSSKNLGGKSSGRRLGIKKMEGHYVHAGNILGTQRHFRRHPGAHVGLGKNKCLYALEEGIVHYTKDVYVPHPRNMEAVDLITRLPKGAVLYKTFVHVVPTKPEGAFKLVAML